MDRQLISAKFDDDSPEPLWELVIGQLLVAGITAGWLLFAGELGLAGTWAERYIFNLFFGLNAIGALVGPLVVFALLAAWPIRRDWRLGMYAGVEAALWFAHLQALRPWL
jgi:hypothetical protein